MHSSRKKAQSLPPLKESISYIQHTLDLMQSGYSKDNHLKIDGSIGDYRMKLFRSKDKKEYANGIKSIFTTTFTNSLLPTHNPDIRAQMEAIIASKRHLEEHEREMREKKGKKEEVVYSKGSLVKDLEEDEGHLMHSNISMEQRNRWFEVKDNSGKGEMKTLEVEVEVSKKGRSLRKVKKNQFVFAYL